MAKEALFNILENRYYIDSKKVLDLFSGTGNIAFEFASRGTEDITAIEQNSDCCNFISKIAHELDYKIDVRKTDCLDFLKKISPKYDIIFADPPYSYEKNEFISLAISHLKENGVLILESSLLEFSISPQRVKMYGDTQLTFWRNKS